MSSDRYLSSTSSCSFAAAALAVNVFSKDETTEKLGTVIGIDLGKLLLLSILLSFFLSLFIGSLV